MNRLAAHIGSETAIDTQGRIDVLTASVDSLCKCKAPVGDRARIAILHQRMY